MDTMLPTRILGLPRTMTLAATLMLGVCPLADVAAETATASETSVPKPDALTIRALDLVDGLETCAPLTRCAADFFRLQNLLEWLEPDLARVALVGIANSHPHPLIRARALWCILSLARETLDMATAGMAASGLGLLHDFVYRSGKAPPPMSALDPKEWTPFPMAPGEGYAALDRVIRPAVENSVVLATRVPIRETTHAVLRLGFDDGVEVWLNGDSVYASEGSQRASLDQVAIPIYLREGQNHLRMEVRQTTGAWRLIARITDREGKALDLTGMPDPWGAVPQSLDGSAPWDPVDLWALFDTLTAADDLEAADIRDAVEFALATHWPGKDRTILELEAEGAFEQEASAANLRAWMRLLEPEKRVLVRAKYPLPETQGQTLDAMMLAVDDGWDDFYGRRIQHAYAGLSQFGSTRAFLPAILLEATLLEDGGLPQAALSRLKDARKRFPGRPALELAYGAALRTAGRSLLHRQYLEGVVAQGKATVSQYFELAEHSSRGGMTEQAVALLDRVTAARQILWQAQVDAAEILAEAGQNTAARERLEKVHHMVRADPKVARRLASLYGAWGRPERAIEILTEAATLHPRNMELRRARTLFVPPERPERLGPPLSALLAQEDPPNVAAHVLFHGIEVDVLPDGRAKRRFRRVVRANQPEAWAVEHFEIPYLPTFQELDIEHAFLLTSSGEKREPRRTESDLSEPAIRLYFDLKSEDLDFGRVGRGDTFDVAWALEDLDPDPALPGHYGEVFFLQETLPRAQSWFGFRSAAPLQTSVTVPNLQPVGGPGVLRFINTPGVPHELFSPGRSSVHGYVHISNARDFDHLAELYTNLIKGRLTPTPTVQKRAKEWTVGIDSTDERVATLYQKVAGSIRYVGLEFGVHSFRPAWPEETLNRGFGDCKDRAALLIALASALGIDAQFVLARTRPQGIVGTETASMAIFDHALVYFPTLDKFVDPTADQNDPWTLPPEDQDAQVLVISPPKATDKNKSRGLQSIPSQPALDQRSQLELLVRVALDGRGTGKMTWTLQGHPATLFRRALDGGATQERVMEDALGTRFPGIAMDKVTVSGLQPPRDPLVIGGPVTIPQFLNTETGRLPLSAAHGDPVLRFAMKPERDGAYRLPHRLLEITELEVSLPPSLSPRSMTGQEHPSPVGRSKIQIAVHDGGYTTRTELQIDTLDLTRAEYPAFREWLGKIAQSLGLPMETHRRVP